ncbi:hypothetical protein DdX_15414 [Ditylenchus destructor]|uniref:Uncharacterized protein n=1 Tax=Ditylenchus destructor TaxID=166010 RepID=A0AAD4MQB3_9BILA|nr:hypothetical protein DdX_15414 [Ditylenchus destructor]
MRPLFHVLALGVSCVFLFFMYFLRFNFDGMTEESINNLRFTIKTMIYYFVLSRLQAALFSFLQFFCDQITNNFNFYVQPGFNAKFVLSIVVFLLKIAIAWFASTFGMNEAERFVLYFPAYMALTEIFLDTMKDLEGNGQVDLQLLRAHDRIRDFLRILNAIKAYLRNLWS